MSERVWCSEDRSSGYSSIVVSIGVGVEKRVVSEGGGRPLTSTSRVLGKEGTKGFRNIHTHAFLKVRKAVAFQRQSSA